MLLTAFMQCPVTPIELWMLTRFLLLSTVKMCCQLHMQPVFDKTNFPHNLRKTTLEG